MDNNEIEHRLARIEEQLAKLEHSGMRATEILDVRALKAELRLDRLEDRITDFAEVERLAHEAYIKTHPEAHAEVEEMKTSVFIARRDASIDARINKRDSES